MDTSLIYKTALQTLAGTISFPEVVGALLGAGVHYYQVDYVGLRKTFYGADGAVAVTPLTVEGLPTVAEFFDAPALKAAIIDSQRNGQTFRDFSRRAMSAGVQGYYAFLKGKRVMYLGRMGEQHIEWFPGSAPAQSS
ncbi:DUF1398 domain-containing protein [Nibricoccus aquaticus]|uniref:DUF1398 domain-containing protein n=1 Tax=Nibricoccus aquaticus TaxID=2576891 RepID=A0A290QJQ6_9BACT|nr:DUF1398 family protein [Nibricoccus aquaticus]ATC65568.1 DUF1398 domain-containing protein [Nibricoccus aquaticus]